MNSLKYHIFTLLFLFCFLNINTVNAADRSAGIKNGVMWQSGVNRFIKYAKQDSDKFGKNDHPIELQIPTINVALQALQYEDKGGFLSNEMQMFSVFSFQQIKLLGEELAKGLKYAKPDQDIIFQLEKVQRKALGLQDKRFLGGRAFYKEGKLNIIIGDYDFFRSEAFEKAYDPSGREDIPYNINHGHRTRASKAFKGVFLNVTGIDNKKLDRLRHDWFVIDLKVAADAYIAEKNRIENPVSSQERQLEVEAAKLAKQRREMRAEMARMRKEVQDISNKESSSTKSIEERIDTLDQLLDKKLITQDEYDTKRQEILSDI
jgi:putative oligomerization/nucleic acid binding protein